MSTTLALVCTPEEDGLSWAAPLVCEGLRDALREAGFAAELAAAEAAPARWIEVRIARFAADSLQAQAYAAHADAPQADWTPLGETVIGHVSDAPLNASAASAMGVGLAREVRADARAAGLPDISETPAD